MKIVNGNVVIESSDVEPLRILPEGYWLAEMAYEFRDRKKYR